LIQSRSYRRFLTSNKSFKRLTPDKKLADKTTLVIRLEPIAVGQARVRFAGQILGYDRTFDVLVEVEAAKKE
jgi:hypothetical protein